MDIFSDLTVTPKAELPDWLVEGLRVAMENNLGKTLVFFATHLLFAGHAPALTAKANKAAVEPRSKVLDGELYDAQGKLPLGVIEVAFEGETYVVVQLDKMANNASELLTVAGTKNKVSGLCVWAKDVVNKLEKLDATAVVPASMAIACRFILFFFSLGASPSVGMATNATKLALKAKRFLPEDMADEEIDALLVLLGFVTEARQLKTDRELQAEVQRAKEAEQALADGQQVLAQDLAVVADRVTAAQETADAAANQAQASRDAALQEGVSHKVELEALQSQVDKLQEELNRKAEADSLHEEKVAALEAQLEEAKRKAQLNQESTNQLKKKVSDVRKQLDGKTAIDCGLADAADRRHTAVEADVAVLKQQASNTNAQVSHAQAQIDGVVEAQTAQAERTSQLAGAVEQVSGRGGRGRGRGRGRGGGKGGNGV